MLSNIALHCLEIYSAVFFGIVLIMFYPLSTISYCAHVPHLHTISRTQVPLYCAEFPRISSSRRIDTLLSFDDGRSEIRQGTHHLVPGLEIRWKQSWKPCRSDEGDRG